MTPLYIFWIWIIVSWIARRISDREPEQGGKVRWTCARLKQTSFPNTLVHRDHLLNSVSVSSIWKTFFPSIILQRSCHTDTFTNRVDSWLGSHTPIGSGLLYKYERTRASLVVGLVNCLPSYRGYHKRPLWEQLQKATILTAGLLLMYGSGVDSRISKFPWNLKGSQLLGHSTFGNVVISRRTVLFFRHSSGDGKPAIFFHCMASISNSSRFHHFPVNGEWRFLFRTGGGWPKN